MATHRLYKPHSSPHLLRPAAATIRSLSGSPLPHSTPTTAHQDVLKLHQPAAGQGHMASMFMPAKMVRVAATAKRSLVAAMVDICDPPSAPQLLVDPTLVQGAKGALYGASALPVYRAGDAIIDPDDDAQEIPRRYTRKDTLVVLDVSLVAYGDAGRKLQPMRVTSILKGIIAGVKFVPIDVDANDGVINGNHRLYVSQLLQLPHIIVRRS